jgi:hypothetical protein
MPIQRSPKQQPPADGRLYLGHPPQQEPEKIQLATAPSAQHNALTEYEPAAAPAYAKLPVTPLPAVDVSYLDVRAPRKAGSYGRSVPIILSVTCLVLLLASSLLAYIFINKKPALPTPILTSTPGQLRAGDTFTLAGSNFGARDLVNFTRDVNIAVLDGNGRPLQAHTNDAGTFSVHITVQANWEVGQHFIHATDETQQLSVSTAIIIQQPPPTPPRLQLSVTSVDLGTGAPGKVSTTTLILTNAGGGQLNWQASSDQSWLSVSPNTGTFSGKAVVALMVNRGALAPQTYSGDVLFTQQGSNDAPLKVNVTMTVVGQAVCVACTSANLTLSSGSLMYTGSTTRDPSAQTIALQNSGSRPLDWSSTVITGDGTPWLSISPSSGHLEANDSEVVTISVQSHILAVGSYSATINFRGGNNPQLSVALNVVASENLLVSPSALNIQTTTGQNPQPQMITLQDNGGQPLDWNASAATVDGANWLGATPGNGHLEAGARTNVTVNINASTLKAGSYQGTLTFSDGTFIRQVTVALTVSVPQIANIGIQTGALTFTTTQGTDPQPQTFSITNTGTATLNWSLTEDQNGKNFAAVTPTSGSLAPGKSATITVTAHVARANPGTINATITVADSDTGTTVQSQSVEVGITINGQTLISGGLALSPNALSFSNTSTLNHTSQLLSITNTTGNSLNWSMATSVSWLSANTPSGTLAPGEMVVIYVKCDSSQLSTGSYNAILMISGSDGSTSASVNVTLTVSP